MPIPLNQVTVAEVSMKGLIDSGGSTPVNTNFVFHYRRLATAIDPTKAALNTIFGTGVAAPIALALNEGWNATIRDIRWVNDAEDPYSSFTASEAGAITGDRMDTFAAAYFLQRTAKRGRKFRGSKHLAPFSESDATAPDGDLFNGGCLTRLATIATAMSATLTDSTGNSWKLTILSRKDSVLALNPTTVVVNDVVAILVNKRIGSMLRRKVKSVY